MRNNATPLYYRYAMYLRKYLWAIAFLLAVNACFSQHVHRPKPWKATAFFEKGKITGILSHVTDSSMILLDRVGIPDEILFKQVKRIRLVKGGDKAGKRVIGFVAGSVTGAVVLSNALSKGRTGEPAVLGGVFGGIVGGIAGALAGIVVAPGIYNLIAAKRIKVKQEALFYPLLRDRLRIYALKDR